jgi:NADP-dependent 3-hydroxy acid dehydrogenase YdfG
MPFAKPSSSEQKVVLITGATSGIGQACAEHLAGLGWRVFGTRRASSAAPPNDTRFEMITMDVDDDASVQSGVETLLAKTGRLDAVVNNAGIALMGPIEGHFHRRGEGANGNQFFWRPPRLSGHASGSAQTGWRAHC